MEPSERIDRMEADGTISAGQAAMLRASMGTGGPEGPVGPAARGRRTWLVWALAAAALTAAVLAFTLPGGDGSAPAVQDVTRTLNEPGGYGEMNRTFSAGLAVALLLVVPLFMWAYLHNGLVAKEEKVFEAWAQTESNFQRRADLIPALVETVSRYLRHERETLTGVTQARAEAADLSTAMDDLIRAQKASGEALHEAGRGAVEDEARLRRLYETQAAMGRVTGKVFVVAEAYPDLHSSDQFLQLQAQLEGTENRINVARMRFNDAVRDYNATMRKLPWSLIANLGRFRRKAYFRSDKEAQATPELGFD